MSCDFFSSFPAATADLIDSSWTNAGCDVLQPYGEYDTEFYAVTNRIPVLGGSIRVCPAGHRAG